MKHLAQQDPDSTKEREETASMTKKELEARLDVDQSFFTCNGDLLLSFGVEHHNVSFTDKA